MPNASLRHLRPGWIFFGWFVAVAVTSLLVIAAMGAVGRAGHSGVWVLASTFVGFLGGGYLLGARVPVAPVLHGAAMGMVSLLVWIAANLIGSPLHADAFRDTTPGVLASTILVQMVAASLGGRLGSRAARP